MNPPQITVNGQQKRLLSLDVMRGFIMLFLAGESCRVYESLHESFSAPVFSIIISQFFHHPWHGLRFWDVVQPAFMLMAGAALYISWNSKSAKGISWNENLKHILLRCFKLFLFGTALHCVYAGKLVWELWNVLTQLSVTTLIAYFIIRKSYTWQIVFSVFLLIVTEMMYRFILVPGFDQPFTQHHNFGAYADTLLMGKINTDGWVAINFIPTTVHTIWGVLAGKLVISSISQYQKIKVLVITGIIALLVGYSMDTLGITPIIKRISTSSFALVSGGWVLLILAFLFWLHDVKKYTQYAWVFTVVGMNAIFIYLFFETVGVQWLNGVVGIFVNGFLSFIGISKGISIVITALATLAVEWYICFWLYQRKIFFKL